MHLRRKSEKRKTGLKLLLVVVLVMCGVLTYNRGKAETKEKELMRQKEAKEQQLEAGKDRQQELKDTAAYQQTTKYMEDKAREAGFVYPDEIILRGEEAE